MACNSSKMCAIKYNFKKYIYCFDSGSQPNYRLLRQMRPLVGDEAEAADVICDQCPAAGNSCPLLRWVQPHLLVHPQVDLPPDQWLHVDSMLSLCAYCLIDLLLEQMLMVLR